MTTDITELAQSHELRNKVNHRLYGALEFQGTSGEHATITLSIDECKSIIAAMDERLALVEALEKAQGMESYWKTQFRGITDHCEELQARIAELESHKAALLKFIRDSCYVFDGADEDISDAYVDAITSGLMPKLESVAACNPPLFWVRVKSDGGYEGPIHDSKLEGVRKKSGEWLPLALTRGVPELESRTVKLPELRQSVSGDRYVWSDGVYNYSQDVKAILADAGIKVEAE